MIDQKELKEIIRSFEKTGSPFAFVIDDGDREVWVVVEFKFYEIDPDLKWTYLTYVQSHENQNYEFHLEHKDEFLNIDDLVNYLLSQGIDIGKYRAMH